MRHRPVLSVAMFAIALAAGCSNKVNDAALVTTIKSEMFSDAQLKDSNLQVTSTNGQVTLAGSVSSDAARYEAFKLATQTPGVTKVNDQMSVMAAQTSSPAPIVPAPEPKVVAAPAPPKKIEEPRKVRIKEHEPPAGTGFAQDYGVPLPAPSVSEPPPQPSMDNPAAQPAAAPEPPPPPPPPPAPQPRPVQVAAGSTITIRMIDGVDSSVNKAGEVFHASLEVPIVVDNEVIVPKGADVSVRLSNASSAGHISGQSELHLELVKMEFQGKSYPLVSSTYSVSGESRGKDSAKKIGGGAVLGALIGAIAGGGKGAAIGAGVGGGAGTVYQGATQGKAVKIPSETKLDFQLDQPVTVNVLPRDNGNNNNGNSDSGNNNN
jgi:outer membrane lipoprotein SlyB